MRKKFPLSRKIFHKPLKSEKNPTDIITVNPRDGTEAVRKNREKSGMEAAELTFAKIGGVSSATIIKPPSAPPPIGYEWKSCKKISYSGRQGRRPPWTFAEITSGTKPRYYSLQTRRVYAY